MHKHISTEDYPVIVAILCSEGLGGGINGENEKLNLEEGFETEIIIPVISEKEPKNEVPVIALKEEQETFTLPNGAVYCIRRTWLYFATRKSLYLENLCDNHGHTTRAMPKKCDTSNFHSRRKDKLC